jgi:dephospho-CoA kinase
MLLVALTGGIGSGKSTVAGGLAARGAPLIDADGIAREVVAPGGRAYAGLVERFGPSILDDTGNVRRPTLAAIVFSDPDALADLNRLTHPAIGEVIVERAAALADHAGPVVLDVPLLNASTIELYRPRALLVVDTPEETAVHRLVAHRGFTEADARARMAAQVTRQERLGLLDLVAAGLVVDNSGDLAALEQEVDRAWSWIGTLDD